MAVILLKDVIAAVPAQGTMTLSKGANNYYPSSTVVNLVDNVGNQIDATAVTITATARIFVPATGPDGNPASIVSTLYPVVDLSVAGQMTVTIPYQAPVTTPINNTQCRLIVAAIDAAGGTLQLLCNLTILYSVIY